MTSPVNVNRSDFRAIAGDAWGDPIPDWVEVLAAEAMRTTGAATAKRIGYSGAVVSQVLRRSYPGDLAAVEERVRGAFMGATVECPVVGEIGRDRCLHEQEMPRTGASAMRMRLFHACRSGCPHSRLKGGADVDPPV